jgi:hypothetical protein
MKWPTLLVVGMCGLAGAAHAQQQQEDPKPWRLHEAAGAPSWLRFGLEHRSRFENLEDDFRASNAGDARAYVLRTLLSVEARGGPVAAGVELQDSRAYASDSTPLTTGIVNTFELLQAYVRLEGKDLLVAGDAAMAKVGRFTIDLGSRRLVARNEFRNTINGFTGVELKWTSPGQHVARAFAVLPVTRLPSEPERLARNAYGFDEESRDALLWALVASSAPVGPQVQVEGYLLGLHERDGEEAASSNRRLLTPGVRVLRAPADGSVDFQLEGILQVGTSRATSAPTDTTDLRHRAGLLSATLGYRFAAPWTPRLAAHYDYASGDADSGDGRNGRFDPLFSARRFDFGPTGLYGALARSNLSSPGALVEVAPHADVDAFVAYRAAWLASKRDAWTTADLRDPSGASGSFIGHQVETRVRWHVMPRNLTLELGGARLVRGGFARSAPNARGAGSTYLYSSLTGTL